MAVEYKRKNVWQYADEKLIKDIYSFGDDYKKFIDISKTEREAVKEIIRQAKEVGYVDFNDTDKNLKWGDKVYLNYRNKAVVLMIWGMNIENGMNIIGSHIDAPRIDVKANPLYEGENLALLKTHYYGGVKKYQWICRPLALHGLVANEDGELIELHLGEEEDEPVFFINDLLIHLSADQMEKKLKDGITGEQLNAIIGHSSFGKNIDTKNPIKLRVLEKLYEKYKIREEDFLIAEFELVPAGKSRDVGIDRALIAGHGHDDRVCSYASLRAMLEIEKPDITAVGLYVDKEEIGSVGNTSMNSSFFELMIAEILATKVDNALFIAKKTLANSRALSADVTYASDSNFPEVDDPLNSSKIGCGVSISKYTGSRGKGGCNDANAEFLSYIRKLFLDNDVVWQTSELGKVDQGGGGTIAYILANYGAEVVDCGTPVLSMHAPMEIVSKADAFMTYKAYKSFVNGK